MNLNISLFVQKLGDNCIQFFFFFLFREIYIRIYGRNSFKAFF